MVYRGITRLQSHMYGSTEVKCSFLAPLFSKKKKRYCLGVFVNVFVQKLTFCNITVIIEDIYLKLGVCVHYQTGNLYYQGRQFKMHFFPQLCPFLDYDFLSSIKHSTAERGHLHVMLFFNYLVPTR